MKKKEYVTFANGLEDLTQGQEIELTIKDLSSGPRKYENRYVKAKVSNSPEQLPDGDILWVRFPTGVLYPLPWAIKITQVLKEFMPK